MQWTTADMPELRGKLFVVTGANAGIGLAIVNALAAKHAQVVLACRDPTKGEAARSRILANDNDARIEVEELDLASLVSVRAFAQRMLSRHRAIDGLINNAGVAIPSLGRTREGFETQFGVNFLGHFALVGRLLPLLSEALAGRVVSMSSLAHWIGHIDFANLNAERAYSKTSAYYQSKLANLIFAYELQRRLALHRSRVTSMAAHPGVCRSDLFRHSRTLAVLFQSIAQPIEMGALPPLMAATAPSIRGGDYIGPGSCFTVRGYPTVQRSSRQSHDLELGARLWDTAEALIRQRYLTETGRAEC